jgi:hypothetical protein
MGPEGGVCPRAGEPGEGLVSDRSRRIPASSKLRRKPPALAVGSVVVFKSSSFEMGGCRSPLGVRAARLIVSASTLATG